MDTKNQPIAFSSDSILVNWVRLSFIGLSLNLLTQFFYFFFQFLFLLQKRRSQTFICLKTNTLGEHVDYVLPTERAEIALLAVEIARAPQFSGLCRFRWYVHRRNDYLVEKFRMSSCADELDCSVLFVLPNQKEVVLDVAFQAFRILSGKRMRFKRTADWSLQFQLSQDLFKRL